MILTNYIFSILTLSTLMTYYVFYFLSYRSLQSAVTVDIALAENVPQFL